MSDEAVLRSLMDSPRLTRAELAVMTGLSKPTTGEAIRRLEAAGLVRDTGERTTSRGGVGTYYALAEEIGVALAMSIAPEGVVAEALDAAGTIISSAARPVRRPAEPAGVTIALRRAARDVLGSRQARTAAVSVASPVDKRTGDLVHLPDEPFLVDAMAPATTLAPLVAGPILVDNDVNWAARAEQAARADGSPDGKASDFVYLYLGEGIGCAVVTDGQVRRGHSGLAGEIAHVCVRGPDAQAVPLIAMFGQLGLRHADSTAIDVDRLLSRLPDRGDHAFAVILAAAISGVLDAAVAFADPEFIVIGGSWGSAILTELRAAVAQRPRTVALEPPLDRDNPFLTGARTAAVDALRDHVIAGHLRSGRA